MRERQLQVIIAATAAAYQLSLITRDQDFAGINALIACYRKLTTASVQPSCIGV